MNNLIVYGSLINNDELLKENISFKNIEKVKIYGFKRVFNQEPSYRLENSINRAVLNIIEADKSWFNAILINNISSEYLHKLDIREKGYNKTYLKEKQVITYENNIVSNCIIYKGRSEKRNDKILPNFEYLNICLKGAEDFGKEFLHDFLKTTYKNSNDGFSLI